MAWINHRLVIWCLLGLPSIPLLIDFYFDERYYSELMYESGVLSVQLLVLTLAISPFTALSKRVRPTIPFSKWLLRRRRYFGVASFLYALLHLAFYIRQTEDVETILYQVTDLKFGFGWAAFVIFILLAATSNETSIRLLKHRWKSLHRWVYLATAFTFLHWYQFGFFLNVMWVWLVLVLVPQTIRLYFSRSTRP